MSYIVQTYNTSTNKDQLLRNKDGRIQKEGPDNLQDLHEPASKLFIIQRPASIKIKAIHEGIVDISTTNN